MAKEWSDVLGCSEEKLLSLKPDEQFLLLQERGEVVSRRLDYLSDACYEGHFDDNRFYSI
jgi:hypothetical protein